MRMRVSVRMRARVTVRMIRGRVSARMRGGSECKDEWGE